MKKRKMMMKTMTMSSGQRGSELTIGSLGHLLELENFVELWPYLSLAILD